MARRRREEIRGALGKARTKAIGLGQPGKPRSVRRRPKRPKGTRPIGMAPAGKPRRRYY